MIILILELMGPQNLTGLTRYECFHAGEKSGHCRMSSSGEEEYGSRMLTPKNDTFLSLEQDIEWNNTDSGAREAKHDAGNIGFVLNRYSSTGDPGVEEKKNYADSVGYALKELTQHTQCYASGSEHSTLKEENSDIPSSNIPETAAIDEVEEESSIVGACRDDTYCNNNVTNRASHPNGHGASQSWGKIWQYEAESDAKLPVLSEETYSETIKNVLDIAKGLPKNVTLQEKLDYFCGRIDIICGNAILDRLMEERLYRPALSLF